MSGADSLTPAGGGSGGGPGSTTSSQERLGTPVSVEVENSSYSNAVGNQAQEQLSYLVIKLKKTTKESNIWLNMKEQSTLVFKKFKIPRHLVKTVDAGSYGEIIVTLRTSDADLYKVSHMIEVKPGIVTLPMKTVLRPKKVTIQGAGKASNDSIKSMLEHFGTVESEIVTFFREEAEVALLGL